MGPWLVLPPSEPPTAPLREEGLRPQGAEQTPALARGPRSRWGRPEASGVARTRSRGGGPCSHLAQHEQAALGAFVQATLQARFSPKKFADTLPADTLPSAFIGEAQGEKEVRPL